MGFFSLIKSGFHAFLAGNPQNDLKFIGVTGSSGKSTTAAMIYHILSKSGIKAGLISSEGAISGNITFALGIEIIPLQVSKLFPILRKMRSQGVKWVVFETSTADLESGIFGNIAFDTIVFTNIKKDHPDSSKSWEDYANLKFQPVKLLKKEGAVIINQDDISSFAFIQNKLSTLKSKINSITYSKSLETKNIISDYKSTSFQYRNALVNLNTIGDFNVDNWLAAIKTAERFQINANIITSAAKDFKGIEGRMQVIYNVPFLIIVDYARNNDALEKSLISASNLKSEDAKLISIIGAPGEKEFERRSAIGRIASNYSDIVLVTAEDPRSESLYDINSKVIEGAESGEGILVKRFRSQVEYFNYKRTFTELVLPTKAVFSFDEPNINSRYCAIDFGVFLASAGDVIITEGKGQDKFQIFNTPNGLAEFAFTDQDAVRRALSLR